MNDEMNQNSEETTQSANQTADNDAENTTQEETASCHCEDSCNEEEKTASPGCRNKKKALGAFLMRKMTACFGRPMLKTKVSVDCCVTEGRESDEEIVGCHFHTNHTFSLLHVMAGVLAFAGICALLSAILRGGNDEDSE